MELMAGPSPGRLLPHSPPVGQPTVHLLCRSGCVELLGIEPAADPLQQLLVLLVLVVADGFEKVPVAPHATAVLGRTGAGTLQAHWVLPAGLGGCVTLDQDLMFPRV